MDMTRFWLRVLVSGHAWSHGTLMFSLFPRFKPRGIISNRPITGEKFEYQPLLPGPEKMPTRAKTGEIQVEARGDIGVLIPCL